MPKDFTPDTPSPQELQAVLIINTIKESKKDDTEVLRKYILPSFLRSMCKI